MNYIAEDYWSTIRPTYIENWPRELLFVSIHSSGVRLTTDETIVLGSNQQDYFELWEDHPDAQKLAPIERKLQRAFDVLRHPGFVRLGSRSPKDTMRWYEHGPRVWNAKEALRLLLGGSERVNDDLLLAKINNYTPWIWVREWMQIEKPQEFRCFVQGRRLVGVSQYWYDSDYSLGALADELARVITTFFEYEVLPALHIDDVVVDVVVQPGADRWHVTLIELNPFFKLTDPCLFEWYKFDGTMRYIEQGAKVRVKF